MHSEYFLSSTLISNRDESERAVTANLNARCDPGTGANIFNPFVCLGDPHDPSLFCLLRRNSQPLSKLFWIWATEGFNFGGVLLLFFSATACKITWAENIPMIQSLKRNRNLFGKELVNWFNLLACSSRLSCAFGYRKEFQHTLQMSFRLR